MSRRILVITTSRADYGLLCPLLDALAGDPDIDVQLAACGSHLAPDFGETVQEIEADGRHVAVRFPTVLPEGEPMANSLALATRGAGGAIARLDPDIVLLPGDRYEILAAASAALVARVPVAHYGGGQLTEGAWDDAIRHAVTKLSHLHFTATESYRQRIVQLGENPAHVFVSGSLGLDNIARAELWSREALERDLGFSFGSESALVTFHPATLEAESPGRQVNELLEALDAFPEMRLVFTQPNADEGGRAVARAIREFVDDRRERCLMVMSLGRTRYLSALRIADFVIGNSSSGIIEAPSFGIPTVNIGDRQRGRIRAATILDCPPERSAIAAAIARACDPAFRAGLVGAVNPYGDGRAAGRIHRVLREFPLDNLLRKQFHDIDFRDGNATSF